MDRLPPPGAVAGCQRAASWEGEADEGKRWWAERFLLGFPLSWDEGRFGQSLPDFPHSFGEAAAEKTKTTARRRRRRTKRACGKERRGKTHWAW